MYQLDYHYSLEVEVNFGLVWLGRSEWGLAARDKNEEPKPYEVWLPEFHKGESKDKSYWSMKFQDSRTQPPVRGFIKLGTLDAHTARLLAFRMLDYKGPTGLVSRKVIVQKVWNSVHHEKKVISRNIWKKGADIMKDSFQDPLDTSDRVFQAIQCHGGEWITENYRDSWSDGQLVQRWKRVHKWAKVDEDYNSD